MNKVKELIEKARANSKHWFVTEETRELLVDVANHLEERKANGTGCSNCKCKKTKEEKNEIEET